MTTPTYQVRDAHIICDRIATAIISCTTEEDRILLERRHGREIADRVIQEMIKVAGYYRTNPQLALDTTPGSVVQ